MHHSFDLSIKASSLAALHNNMWGCRATMVTHTHTHTHTEPDVKASGWPLYKSNSGGAGHRSPCLWHAKSALYHMSYTPQTLIKALSGVEACCDHLRAMRVWTQSVLCFYESTAVWLSNNVPTDTIVACSNAFFWHANTVYSQRHSALSIFLKSLLDKTCRCSYLWLGLTGV